MKTFLFQGDSITDAGRFRDNYDGSGSRGYPTLVAASYGMDHPGEMLFVNRAVSGDRSVSLYERIKADILNVKPDYISILIGVNDVWHELSDNPNGVSDEKYFRVYSMLIEEIKEALPDVKIFILEPFVLKASATEGSWDYFRSEVEKRAASAKRIAEKYGLIFIPLQEKFDKAATLAEPSFWLADGVHPAPAGHELIKRELIKALEENK
ncbi:MAG: lysophospholipase [Clostridia bacterium]|nr:lysophospholipase [Clostridia bacterium]